MGDRNFWRSAEELKVPPTFRGKFTLDPDDPFTVMFFTPYGEFSVPITEVGGRSFKEKILPGAFSSSIRRGEVFALYAHNPDRVLGVQNQNFTIAESKDGLRCRLQLEPNQFNMSILDAVDAGELACSVGMAILEDSWPAKDIRYVKKAELHEISLVSQPAYPQTSSCTNPPPKREQPVPQARFTQGAPLAYSLPESGRIIKIHQPGKEK